MKHRSALGRPLDPKYPTNLAVLILAPVAGLIAGGIALRQGNGGFGLVAAAARGGFAAFAGWALAREIAPDDNAAAFVCLGMTFLASLLVPASSVLLVVTSLMLVRIVNRSVGVPATIVDSLALCLLAGWTVYNTGTWAPAGVAAVAFALDAVLPSPLRRQWIFAIVCLLGALLCLILPGQSARVVAAGTLNLPTVTIAAIYAWSFLRLSRVNSVADRTGKTLTLSRVRAGMAVVWLMAVQGPLLGDTPRHQTSMIWAILAGLVLMMLFRSIFPPESRLADEAR